MLGESSFIAAAVERLRAPRKATGEVKLFEFGDGVLVAHWTVFSRARK